MLTAAAYTWLLLDAALPIWVDIPTSDDTRARAVVLYHVEGQDLYEGLCDKDRVLYDRSTCGNDVRHVPLTDIYAAVAPKFGAGLAAAEQQVRDLIVKVQQTDAKIIEMEDGAAPTDGPDIAALRHQLDLAQTALAPIDTQVAGIDDQIARIESQLAHDADADLLQQLGTLRAKRQDLAKQQSGLVDQIDALRQQIITARSSILDQSTFQSLETRRKAYADQLIAENQTLVDEEKSKAAMARAFKFVADPGFVYDYTVSTPDDDPASDEAYVLSAARDAFVADYAKRTEFRTIGTTTRYCDAPTNSCQVVTTLSIPNDGTMATLACAITGSQHRCGEIQVAKVEGVQAPGFQALEVPFDNFSWNYLLEHGQPLWTVPARGLWAFQGLCAYEQPFSAEIACSGTLQP